MNNAPDDEKTIHLPGYTLSKRLGAGGYGEVWLAHAPGGLTKAVKLIYGFHDEKRAAHELRSLEKIKEVRHPFLLSLERIEVIDGRLVIVTELADASLMDRFKQCVAEGLPGLPRNELLKYLRDAADALDFLSEKHSLQHLDVKPENLLLLAGHVKVADFGLVKEIQQTQASLVGGLTPIYSSPEVFQGRPSRQSDQYSLAVLYQEMLTGLLPFQGVTAAELTLQHMHDDPNLGPLPLRDRYVLARALSKDPQRRFDSSSELIQALMDDKTLFTGAGPSAKVATSPETLPVRAPECDYSTPRPVSVTQIVDEDLPASDANISDSMLLEMPPSPEIASPSLPALELSSEGFQPTPTLVIGIGGAAGHVLRKLRQRIASHFDSLDELPAVQMLLLDTDPKAVLDATRDDQGGALSNEETLTLPLKRPQEYRERSGRILQWLSRRWLYNIPKSLRTEGLRPLGRLAFADHARRTNQRLRLALSQAIDGESLLASKDRTGLEFRTDAVRVYVVASISGGTGGGMSLDVGYMVKGLLENLGLSQARTAGIFLHSTGRGSRFRDLAKVNAFSWLTEFNHFHRAEGAFPGDEACGLPARQPGQSAFDSSYLVHLGEQLDEEEFVEATESVAEYLLFDLLSPAQAFFDAGRAISQATPAGAATLRSFGLRQVSSISEGELQQVVRELCHRVVLGWAGPASGPSEADTSSDARDTDHLVSGAAHEVAQLQINLEGIASHSRTLLEGQFGSNVEGLLAKMLTEHAEQGAEPTMVEIVQVVDGLFADPSGVVDPDRPHVMQRPLAAIASPLGMRLVEHVRRWILHRLDDRRERLSGAQSAAEWFSKHFRAVEQEALKMAENLSQQLEDAVRQLLGDNVSGDGASIFSNRTPHSANAIRYFRLRLDLCALQTTIHLARMLQADLKNTRETIVEFGRHLRGLADSLAGDPGDCGPGDEQTREHEGLANELRMVLPQMAQIVDDQLQEGYIDRHGGLLAAVMGSRKIVTELLANLELFSRKNVEQASRASNPVSHMLESGKLPGGQESLVRQMVEITPRLLEAGGAARKLVILPTRDFSDLQVTQLRNQLGNDTSILSGGSGDLLLCSEASLLPVDRAALQLIDCRRDYAEFAARVQTRGDVSWTPLIQTEKPRTDGAREFATQVL